MTMTYPLATWRNEFSCRLRTQEVNVILSAAKDLSAVFGS